jgi:hypothetical protein
MRWIFATFLAAAAVFGPFAAAGGAADSGPPSAGAAEPSPGFVLPPSVTDGFIASGGGKAAVQPPLTGTAPRQRPAKPDGATRRQPGSFWPDIHLRGSFGFGH